MLLKLGECGGKESQRDVQCERSAAIIEELHGRLEKTCGYTLGAKTGSYLIARKEWGPQFYNFKEQIQPMT